MNGKIAVISAGRPGNVPAMRTHLGGHHADWYVPEEEAGEYAAAGASVRPVAGGLCAARNAALADAWAQGEPSVQLSDDLRRLHWYDGQAKKPMDVPWAVECVLAAMEGTGAKLGGVAPTDNTYFYRGPISRWAFVVGDFIVVSPCGLTFDEVLTLKEDYDYTLQHLAAFGRVARVNGVLASFSHRTNRGGAVRYRTPEEEQRNIARLMDKWPGRLRHNARRPNEVLLVRRKMEDVPL